MKQLFTIIFLTFFAGLNAQHVSYDPISPLENYDFVLGTQGIGGKYKFSHESALVEQAKHIRAMGSNILKISLGKNALDSYGLGKKTVHNTLDLFNASPDFKQVFDMDFKYIFAWVHTCTDVNWKKGISPMEEKILYDEMYDFASYLLKSYNDSGKTFLIGNWEGDWLLHNGNGRESTPDSKIIRNMTKWFQIRQRAIDDAKKNVPHVNVSIYYYIELNLVLKGMKGEKCIAESVLPKVPVDLVSYSSYEAIKNRSKAEVYETLDSVFNYLESKLEPKPGLPFSRRVYIGEYGYQANAKKPETFEKQYNKTKDLMEIALKLNLPFALHWEMYNNEYDNKGNSKQMSLINEEGEKRPLYYLHKNYYEKMNDYLKSYKSENNQYPAQEEFNKKALSVLEELN
ncbi:hypothetical protein [Gaetbulibacter aestuarii]|uniref:Uncharacterized protein n=1 Tax=Gaetbulibacter aestuarii TaxID=1502358 RepID=A0ABW7N2J8_9FLAO